MGVFILAGLQHCPDALQHGSWNPVLGTLSQPRCPAPPGCQQQRPVLSVQETGLAQVAIRVCSTSAAPRPFSRDPVSQQEIETISNSYRRVFLHVWQAPVLPGFPFLEYSSSLPLLAGLLPLAQPSLSPNISTTASHDKGLEMPTALSLLHLLLWIRIHLIL